MKNLVVVQKTTTFAPTIGRWCNGNTTGFGSVIPGSNPSRPTFLTRACVASARFLFF